MSNLDFDALQREMKQPSEREGIKMDEDMERKPWTGFNFRQRLSRLLSKEDMPSVAITGGSTAKDKKLMACWIEDVSGKKGDQDILKVKEYFTNLCQNWPRVAVAVKDNFNKPIPQRPEEINLSKILPLRHYIHDALSEILSRRENVILLTERKKKSNKEVF